MGSREDEFGLKVPSSFTGFLQKETPNTLVHCIYRFQRRYVVLQAGQMLYFEEAPEDSNSSKDLDLKKAKDDCRGSVDMLGNECEVCPVCDTEFKLRPCGGWKLAGNFTGWESGREFIFDTTECDKTASEWIAAFQSHIEYSTKYRDARRKRDQVNVTADTQPNKGTGKGKAAPDISQLRARARASLTGAAADGQLASSLAGKQEPTAAVAAGRVEAPKTKVPPKPEAKNPLSAQDVKQAKDATGAPLLQAVSSGELDRTAQAEAPKKPDAPKKTSPPPEPASADAEKAPKEAAASKIQQLERERQLANGSSRKEPPPKVDKVNSTKVDTPKVDEVKSTKVDTANVTKVDKDSTKVDKVKGKKTALEKEEVF